MLRFPATCLAILIAASTATAQQRRDPRRAFEIVDNSFLVEEAFNQEAGVFQNILLVQRPGAREWSHEFTQEWPIGGQRHQLSYTVPLEVVKPPGAQGYDVARGTIAVHYRYQLAYSADRGWAIAPRVSVLFLDAGAEDPLGLQFNLPVSKQFRDFYTHVNAGFTIDEPLPGARELRWHAAGSAIYRAWPMVHVMLETVYRGEEHEIDGGLEDGWLLSPGFRAGINLGDHQLVLGAAFPVGLLNSYDTQDFIAYISWELPFMRR